MPMRFAARRVVAFLRYNWPLVVAAALFVVAEGLLVYSAIVMVSYTWWALGCCAVALAVLLFGPLHLGGDEDDKDTPSQLPAALPFPAPRRSIP